MKRAMHRLQINSDAINYPFLMMVPLSDRIVSWKAQMDFFANLKMKNPGHAKKILTFTNTEHELFNEIGKERAFVALEDWLSSFR